MTDTLKLTHDSSVEAFTDASGVVESDDDGVTFSWDEDNIVHVDAPSDLEGAFDTQRFYKIDGATIARPIKQPYMVDGDVKWYKKPADELRAASWSFDNAPFTLDHPDTGMVKDVNDVHGFWRNVQYDGEEDRLTADLYVPSNDDEALSFIEDNDGVSVGFHNRVSEDYDGDTGDLTDEENVDGYQVDMLGNHVAGVEHGRCRSEDGCGLDNQNHGTVFDSNMDEASDLESVPGSTEDDSTADCGCGPNSSEDTDNSMSDDTNSDDKDSFDVPDLSVDALAEKNDAVEALVEERDSLEETVDEIETDVRAAFDSADNFTVEIDEDDCVCDAVETVVDDLDEKVTEVEDLRDELQEYRADEIDEKLDTLEGLGADRDEWEETADEADDPLDTLTEEIERREEVLDAAPDTSVKDIDSSTDADETDEDENTGFGGRRTFGRGHGA